MCNIWQVITIFLNISDSVFQKKIDICQLFVKKHTIIDVQEKCWLKLLHLIDLPEKLTVLSWQLFGTPSWMFYWVRISLNIAIGTFLWHQHKTPLLISNSYSKITESHFTIQPSQFLSTKFSISHIFLGYRDQVD